MCSMVGAFFDALGLQFGVLYHKSSILVCNGICNVKTVGFEFPGQNVQTGGFGFGTYSCELLYDWLVCGV